MWTGVTREPIVLKLKPYTLKQPKLYKNMKKTIPRVVVFGHKKK